MRGNAFVVIVYLSVCFALFYAHVLATEKFEICDTQIAVFRPISQVVFTGR